jgi:hypothetical protein
MRTLLRLAILSSIIVVPPAANAQSDAAKALAGAWEISNADHDRICQVALKGDAAAGGLKMEFDRAACSPDFPLLKEAVAWDLLGDNVVRVLGAKGKVLYEFTEVENGTYESLRPGEPLTFLQSAAAAAPPPRTAEEMRGEWSIVRGSSAPICTLTLETTPTGKDEMILQVKPGCDDLVVRFGPVSWHMEHGELVLKSARGPVWRFGEADGTWQRIPEGRDALALVRP